MYYNAADGYTYGDFPIGPYTMKKVSDSQDVVASSASSWYSGERKLNSTRFWPVNVGCPEMTVTPQPEMARKPVSVGGSRLYRDQEKPDVVQCPFRDQLGRA